MEAYMGDYPFKKERSIIKKYLDGRVVDEKDVAMVRELEMTGFLHVGFSLSEHRDTASATPQGRVLFPKAEKNSGPH
jgi:hypothetical protein